MVPEAIVISFLIMLGASGVLASIWLHTRTERYALGWAAMLGSSALGWLVLSLPVPADWRLALAQAVVGDLLYLAGIAGFALGTARFFDLPPPRWGWFAAALAGHPVAWAALLRGDMLVREFTATASAGLLIVCAALLMTRATLRNLGERAMMLSSWAVLGTTSTYLALLAIERPAQVYSLDFLGYRFLSVAMPLAVTALAFSALVAATLRQLDRVRDQARALERAVEDAHRANQAKGAFLGAVSHEIRTPVNAFMGGLQILAATPLDERQAQCVAMMGKAGQSLMAQLDDLLDVTRMEAGRLALEESAFDLHRLLADTVELIAPKAAEKGLSIGIEIVPGVARAVTGDPARLRQVLLNLLGNAIKFTETGGVTVTAAQTGEAPDGTVRVRLSVADTGIGIPADKLAGVFEAFAQADGSISRRFGGAGLGLAISRGIVRLMGGVIGVESTEGLGSAFHVELPLRRAAPEALAAAADAEARLPVWSRPLTLLLVEDEAVNRFVATELLSRRGFTVVPATSGAEALAVLAREAVDAVLMDLGMPGMDGFEATAAIRALPDPVRAATPIIALTANVLPETMARCKAAGMAGFVAKPIRLPVLLRVLAEALPPADTGGDAATGTGVDPAGIDRAVPDARAVRLDDLRDAVGPEVLRTLTDKALAAAAEARAVLADRRILRSRRRMGDIAHRLVASLEVIGHAEAAAAARALEQAAEADGVADLDGLRSALVARLEALPAPAASRLSAE